jgi:hypothetical protein
LILSAFLIDSCSAVSIAILPGRFTRETYGRNRDPN